MPNSKVWGRLLWNDAHYSSFVLFGWGTTAAEQQLRRDYISVFTRRIICRRCLLHWAQIMENRPPRYDNGLSFAQWFVEAHNDVNRLLSKRELPWKEALKIWKERENASEIKNIEYVFPGTQAWLEYAGIAFMFVGMAIVASAVYNSSKEKD